MHGEGLSEQVRRGLEGSIQDQVFSFEFEENRGFVRGSKEEGGKSSIGLPDLADLESR